MSRLLAAAALIALLTVSTAIANHEDPGAASTLRNVQPSQVDGNPTCSQLLGADLLFEYKLEPVKDAVVPLSFGDQNGTLTVDERTTAAGQVFDFTLTGDFVMAGVFVKGGTNGNLFDYRGLSPDVTADTGLHTPVNKGTYYGLSHLSFCFGEPTPPPPTPVLDVEKTPDGGTVAAGSNAEFTVTVTNNGPGTADDVTLDDVLPAGLAWTDDKAECTIAGAGGNELHCDIGDLAENASFAVKVSAPTTSANCGLLDNPHAVADAANADPADDSGSMNVTCSPPPETPRSDPPPPEPQPDPPIQAVAPFVVSAPVQQSAPQRVVAGAARLAGPTKCVRNTFSVRVIGRRIRSVTFRLGGRTLQTTRAGQIFTARIDPTALSRRVHRVQVRVTFEPASGTAARTRTLAFQRCALQAVRPQFTG